MENQHKLIKGYRDLSQQEIDLMNRIKEQGEQLRLLCIDVEKHINSQWENGEGKEELERLTNAEPNKWLYQGKANLQQGLMKLVRSVAQPEGF